MPEHPKEHHTHKHTNAQTLIPVLSLPLRRLSRLAARYEEQQQHWVKWREGKGGEGRGREGRGGRKNATTMLQGSHYSTQTQWQQ